jgi:hypothetical protein
MSGPGGLVCRALSAGWRDAGPHVREQRLHHDEVHAEQWARHGAVGYLARFLGGYLRGRARGYGHAGSVRRVAVEIEAEWVASIPERASVTPAASPVPVPATEEPSWSSPTNRPPTNEAAVPPTGERAST